MDLNDSPAQAEFRAGVRAWLADHAADAPPALPTGDPEQYLARRRAWQGTLAGAGYAGVTWPAEYGGRGLGPIEQVTVDQELAAAGVPGILDFVGIGMLGPTIIATGTDDQKQRFLGPMLAGEELWCQLFSEPAAGSDLAGVQTRAVERADGGYTVNGQKVWTSFAQHASFGLMLARTDADAPKHKGLTMFIVPMDREGITVRGLRQISGEAEFNEVFLDDVQLDADHVVGGVGNGWKVALTTLMFERLTISLDASRWGYVPERYAGAIKSGAADDDSARKRFGELASDLIALRFSGYRNMTVLAQGQAPGPEAALAKITMVGAAIGATDLVIDVLGPGALKGEWADAVSLLPALKSAGGTEEILRNTVGERVLGLPPEPRADKGIPFSELRAKERATA